MFSLGVSLLYLANAGRIAEVNSSDRMQINQAIIQAMRHGERLRELSDMLQFDPEKRASAQQFLLKLVRDDPEALNLPPFDLKPSQGPATGQATWQGSINMRF